MGAILIDGRHDDVLSTARFHTQLRCLLAAVCKMKPAGQFVCHVESSSRLN